MKLQINVANAKQVAERWRKQYEHDGIWTETRSGDSRVVYQAILACGDDAFAIAKAVGNMGWSFLSCHGCDDYVSIAAVYDSGDLALMLCRNCLNAGASAINAVDGALKS